MIKQAHHYFVFVIVHMSLLFFVYPEKIIESTRTGHWEAILVSVLFEFCVLLIYIKGLMWFPGQDLTDIFHESVGKWVSRILLSPLVLYFFMSIFLLARSHAELLTIVFLPKTPIWALLLLLIIPLYAAWKGIHTIYRSSVLYFILFVPVICLALLSSFGNFHYPNAFPLLNTRPDFFMKPSFYSSLFAYSGFLYLGMVNFFVKTPTGKWQPLFTAFFSLIPFYVLSVYIPLLTFGQEAATKFRFPLILTLDTVDIESLIFNRVTMFYVISTLMFVVIYIALLIWASVRIIKKMFIPMNEKYLAILLTFAAYTAGLLVPGWNWVDTFIWWDTSLRLYCMIAIPVAVFWMAQRKRRHQH